MAGIRSTVTTALKGLASRYAPGALYAFRERRQRAYSTGWDDRPPAEIFTDIYRDKVWGGGGRDFYSGDGSDEDVTSDFVAFVHDYMTANGLTSVVDLGCGDFRVGAQLARPGVDYLGVDVVESLVAHNQAVHGRAGVRFVRLDLVEDPLPDGEVFVLRQVLQHLSNPQIAAILARLDGRRVIVAEHHPAPARLRAPNHEKPPGHGIRVGFGSGVYPDRPPFSQPYVERASLPIKRIVAPGETLAVYVSELMTPGPRHA